MPAVRRLLLRPVTRPAVQMRRLAGGTACRRADSRGGWLPRRLAGDPPALSAGKSPRSSLVSQVRGRELIRMGGGGSATLDAGCALEQWRVPGLASAWPRAASTRGLCPCRRADSAGVRRADAPSRRAYGVQTCRLGGRRAGSTSVAIQDHVSGSRSERRSGIPSGPSSPTASWSGRSSGRYRAGAGLPPTTSTWWVRRRAARRSRARAG
jgi:hypothetical protein